MKKLSISLDNDSDDLASGSRVSAAYAYLELRRTLRHTSTPDDIYINI